MATTTEALSKPMFVMGTKQGAKYLADFRMFPGCGLWVKSISQQEWNGIGRAARANAVRRS